MPERPCANYLAHRHELEGIDEILQRSGIDDFVLNEALEERTRQSENDNAFQKGLGPFINHVRSVWYDATCHCPDIHFPVDWVQLGDCCRTLLKAVRCIRKHGVKNRMPRGGPDKLLHDLNQLIIALGNARRRKDSKSLRKEILRQMKHFARRMGRHARTHRDLLEKHRAPKTTLSAAQAGQIIARIDHVLALLPQAIKQAHERIIGERGVPNEEKILSIHETRTKVIVRGKSGAEVEYGNPLLLGENSDGLIVHWKLFEDVRSDSKLLLGALKATEKTIGAKLQKVVTDRGFSDEKMRRGLAKDHPALIDHICPRSPSKLAEKKTDPDFCRSQTRRAQTEARVAIITNNYQRGRSLSKGLESQRQEGHARAQPSDPLAQTPRRTSCPRRTAGSLNHLINKRCPLGQLCSTLMGISILGHAETKTSPYK